MAWRELAAPARPVAMESRPKVWRAFAPSAALPGHALVCGCGGERDVAHRKQDCLRDCLDALTRPHDNPQEKLSR